MAYEVRMESAPARPTAVLAEATTWAEFPSRWGPLLTEVHGAVRWGGPGPKGRNVMLYLDDVPHVEIGVELDQPVELTGRVTRSALPAGEVATTVHYGSYDGLGAAHAAVLHWVSAQGRAVAGPRWEVYGHWSDDPAEVQTEIFYLLS